MASPSQEPPHPEASGGWLPCPTVGGTPCRLPQPWVGASCYQVCGRTQIRRRLGRPSSAGARIFLQKSSIGVRLWQLAQIGRSLRRQSEIFGDLGSRWNRI